MHHSLLIHLSADGHLGCFHVLSIINSAVMNIGVHVSLSILVSSVVYAQQWDCWVIWQFYFQFFKESAHCSMLWLYKFAFPPTVQEGSLFSTPSLAFIIVCILFDGGHSDRHEMIPHCGFDLHFSNEWLNQFILKEISPGCYWKDWCWSWNFSTLATSWEELTHWTIPWCWEGLGAGGEGDDRGWDGWMASLTRWAWVRVNSGVGDGQEGMVCSDSWGHKESDMTERLNWAELTWNVTNWLPNELNSWSSFIIHFYIQNIQAAPAAQFQKNEWPNQKMGQRAKQTFLQRRHTDG